MAMAIAVDATTLIGLFALACAGGALGVMLLLLLIRLVDEEDEETRRRWRRGAVVVTGAAVKAATPGIVVVVVVDFNKNKRLQYAVKTLFIKRMIFHTRLLS